ncbi:hypothetical protein [Brevundimonas sp.]|uniref:hypothetical protein n=1 Tax=Brevundimonas sp. TaxID=1871086 RepID=UPI00391A0271
MTPRTPAPTQPYTAGEQMDRPVDPSARAAMDRDAADIAMRSRRHAFAGSAAGVGSVAFDDPGAYDVTDPGACPERRLNPDPAAHPHAEAHPDAEAARIRAGGLAPGEDAPGEDDPGARMAETDSFKRPGKAQEPV